MTALNNTPFYFLSNFKRRIKMKFSIIILILHTIYILPTNAQSSDTTQKYIAPQYQGGINKYHEYLHKYLRYPDTIRDQNIEGKVKAYIYIDKEGTVRLVRTQGSVPELNAEVKRVLKLMPPWNPGTLNNEPRDTLISKIIQFSIGKAKNKDEALNDEVFEIVMYLAPLSSFTEADTGKEMQRAAEDQQRFITANKHYNEGVKFLSGNQLEKALIEFNKAIEYGGSQNDFLYNRGIIYFKLNEKRKACIDWIEAYRQNDSDAGILYQKYCK